MTKHRHILGIICESLLIIGAINWGLVGLVKLNLVHLIFNFSPVLEKYIYGLVGAAGLYIFYRLVSNKT